MIIEESDFINPSSLHFPKGEAFFAESITSQSAYLPEEKEKSRENFLTIAEMEKIHILKALQQTGGNKELAAKLLGIGRSTLFRKLTSAD